MIIMVNDKDDADKLTRVIFMFEILRNLSLNPSNSHKRY